MSLKSPEQVLRFGLVLVIVLSAALLLVSVVGAEKLPDCGKNPYRWNGEGKHYERTFSEYCYPFTHDSRELRYDGQYCTFGWPCERKW